MYVQGLPPLRPPALTEQQSKTGREASTGLNKLAAEAQRRQGIFGITSKPQRIRSSSPVGAAEHRSKIRGKRAYCLSHGERSETSECTLFSCTLGSNAHPGFGCGASLRESFLSSLSLRPKKGTRRRGRDPAIKKLTMAAGHTPPLPSSLPSPCKGEGALFSFQPSILPRRHRGPSRRGRSVSFHTPARGLPQKLRRDFALPDDEHASKQRVKKEAWILLIETLVSNFVAPDARHA